MTDIQSLPDNDALPVLRERLAALRSNGEPFNGPPGYVKAEAFENVYVLFRPGDDWQTIVYVASDGSAQDEVVFIADDDLDHVVSWTRGDWEAALFAQAAQ